MASYTTWEDWQVWLLDSSRKPIALLRDAEKFTLTIGAFGQGNWSFEIDPDSEHAALIRMAEAQERYLYMIRKDRHIGGIVLRVLKPYGPGRKMEVSGRTVGCILDFAIMQPQSGQQTVSFAGKVDNVMKQHVRYQCVQGTAYNGPGGVSRGFPGFSVAANKTEHPDTVTLERSGSQLGQELQRWGAYYSVDYDVQANFSATGCTWIFETWYEGRGEDRSLRNTDGNVPVILGETLYVVREAEWFVDLFNFKTDGYTRDATQMVTRPGVSGYLRREAVIKSASTITASMTMQDVPRAFGYTFKFIESPGVQVGQDFWLYDKVTYFNVYLGQAGVDDYISEITFEIQPGGSENIELLFGIDRPDLTDTTGSGSRGGGGARLHAEEEDTWAEAPFGLKDTDGDVAYPDSDNRIQLTEGSFIDVNTTGVSQITIALKSHTHLVSGNTGAGTSHTHGHSLGTGATSHTHGNTLGTGGGSSHTHSLSGNTGSEASHTHSHSYTQLESQSGSSHSHDVPYNDASSGYNVNEASHCHDGSGLSCDPTTHAISGWVSNETSGNHIHSYRKIIAGGGSTVATSSESSHRHVYDRVDATSGSGTSHLHGGSSLTVSGESAHTHSITGSISAETSHTHSVTGSISSESSHTHSVSITSGGPQ